MAARRTGLGKGLDSLIPETIKSTPEGNVRIVEKPAEIKVKISRVGPNREQPRKQFDEESLKELTESIKQFGVIEPLIVREKNGFYEIIAGERRWRAAGMAGLKEVPVVIKDYSEAEAVEISLIENIQRENLNPIEEANAYKRLMEEFNLKQDEVAAKVSKSRSAVTNSMRLLKLDQRVQRMVIDEKLTTGHARALVALDDADRQYAAAESVCERNLTVRDTEKLVKKLLNPKEPAKKTAESDTEDFIYRDLEEKLKSAVESKVSIRRKGNGRGKIEIEYYSDSELERIYEIITAGGKG